MRDEAATSPEHPRGGMKPPVTSHAAGARRRFVVLKRERLYGITRQQILAVWAHATVDVFQRGFAALESIQTAVPDAFVAGVAWTTWTASNILSRLSKPHCQS